MKRLKHATAGVALFLGGGYCYAEAMVSGVEDYAVTEDDNARETASYLLGSVVLFVAAGKEGLKYVDLRNEIHDGSDSIE